MTSTFVTAVQEHLSARLGLDIDTIGAALVDRSVRSRMQQRGLEDAATYVRLLETDDTEAQALTEALVIPETWFFRDREPFTHLRRLARETFLLRPMLTPRILSIPCSSGEEAYSIAITLIDAGLPPERFHVDAYDISTQALERAHLGIYSDASFREPLSPMEGRHFTDVDGGRRVSDEARRAVTFRHANILDNLEGIAGGGYDVIFCRNLIIYMNSMARERIAATLRSLLAPDGMLVTGHAEIMYFLDRGYHPVQHTRSFSCHPAPASAPPVAPPRESRRSPLTPVSSAIPVRRWQRREVSPQPPPMSLATISALADRGCYEEAREQCREYLRHHRHSSEGHFLLGIIEEALQHPTAAIASYDRALYLDPGHYEALIHAGLLYEQCGDTRNATLARERARRVQQQRRMDAR